MKYRLFVYFILLSLVSCRSSQELIFLKNMPDDKKTMRLAEKITEHLIKTGDILYVSVKSINSEINALFNPEEGMEKQSYGSYQKFSTPSGAYLYGFEVNAKGELTLPMLGKFQVEGMTQQKIEELVKKKADVLIKDAIVNVKLLNFKVTVLGEVRTPGVYYNYSNSFNLFDALAMAIFILRYGVSKKEQINFINHLAEKKMLSNLALIVNDVRTSGLGYGDSNIYKYGSGYYEENEVSFGYKKFFTRKT